MDNLENKADEFDKKMEEAANDGWNIVESGADKVGDAASDAKETAAEVAKDAWNTVEDTADKVQDTAGDAWNKVEDAADSAADKVTEKVDDAWGKVEDASETAADKADNAWDKVEDSADKAAIKVGETFTKLGGETTDAWATTAAAGAAAVEHTEAAVEGADAPVDAWKKIDEDARKLEAQMNTAADSGWNKTESAAHEAEKTVEQASADVFTPAAAAPEVSSWQAEIPVEPFGEPATPPKPEDTWTAPVFTPTPVQTQSIGSGGYVPPVSPSIAQKKFPTWAIILIVLLVLCVCGGLGIWIFTNIFRGAIDGASLFLALLM